MTVPVFGRGFDLVGDAGLEVKNIVRRDRDGVCVTRAAILEIVGGFRKPLGDFGLWYRQRVTVIAVVRVRGTEDASSRILRHAAVGAAAFETRVFARPLRFRTRGCAAG